MTFSSAPRPDNAASIVGGLLGGLAVAGSVLAFLAFRDPRGVTDESVADLRVAVAELRAQTAELRAQMASQPQPLPPPPPVMMYPPPPPPPTPIIEINTPTPPPLPPANDAISCREEHRCTIDRNYLIELSANPAALARQMRVIPSIKDGETRGLKLYGIRPGSLPNLLGYKNGDLLLSVNGLPFTSPETALGAYSRLRTADTFSVEIERKGERLLKTCDIR